LTVSAHYEVIEKKAGIRPDNWRRYVTCRGDRNSRRRWLSCDCCYDHRIGASDIRAFGHNRFADEGSY